MAKYTPVQMHEETWYRVKGYTHTECCDCALVHKEHYRLIDGHLEWMATRDEEATAARRKELGIKITYAKKDHRRADTRRSRKK